MLATPAPALPNLAARGWTHRHSTVRRAQRWLVKGRRPDRTLLPPGRSTDHIRFRGHEALREATHHLPQQVVAFCLELVA